MSLPRFRLRTLMAAVAAAGLVLGGLAWIAKMRRLAERYRALGQGHSQQIYLLKGDPEGIRMRLLYGDPGLTQEQRVRLRARVDRESRLAAYHSALAEKYFLAADRPWRPVEPDPPEPP
jgi:hypothetical protein